MVPRTILQWPLNAVIYWILSMGMVMGMATLLWWDIFLKKNISLLVYAILAEAFFSSVSLLSRATYIFHVIPQLLSLYKNKQALVGVSRKKAILIAVAFVGLFVISISAITILRNYYYSNVPINFNSAEGLISSSRGVGAARFIIDRWIGVEGVMAVYSYPKKNDELFLSVLTERPKIGGVTFYQKVCKSHYQGMDMNKYTFASLPGAAAFFYYTGSLGYVFLGLLVLTLAALFSESLVLSMTGNMLLCSIYGMYVANLIAQIGVAPRQLLVHLFMVFCGLIFIWLLKSGLVANLLRKAGLHGMEARI
ncbi:MAG: hypothetical protein CVU80_02845 [Elusimicrobia bacterium HGW-Elusimicrobia-4]|nr:MAG: hypothetical protein CVU80_02845 [Elusimicrobia bacterium HGW-Elusimicrobia-4]